MTELEIVEVDPHDEPAAVAWLEARVAAARHQIGEHATMWTTQELLAMIQRPDKARRVLLLNGLLGDAVVVAGYLSLRLLDNLDAAEVDVAVRPDVRRRGFGSQMLARLEEDARAAGRSRFDAEVRWPYDGPTDGAGAPGAEFAKAHGYSFGLGDVQRELDLPVDETLLTELAAAAAPYHSDYEIRSWEGPISDELVVSWLELSSTLMTEAPTGEMEREAEAVDVEAHRQLEETQAKQGRTTWHTVALDRAGAVVAYTQLVVPSAEQRFIYQWGTLVHRAHRGHRLGTAVKVANHRSLQAEAEVTGRRVVTWNAEVNDQMIGINELLGFTRTARNGEFQKKVG